MKAQLLNNGPHLHGIGWLNNDYSVATLAMASSGQDLHGPVVFDGSGGYEFRPGMRLPDELPVAVGRSSGVARARSAAKSTVYAALLGKNLLQTLDNAQIPGERVGVGIAATSDTTYISHEFESVGVRNGWGKTDTMLLPSSIPSAITTQTSAVFDTHAAAIAFQAGARGMCAALEYAHLSFTHRRSDAFLIIGADETCTVQSQALDALEDPRARTTGASGMVLTSKPMASSGSWQLTICTLAPHGETIELPEDWDDAQRLTVNIPNASTIFTASLVPLALQQLLSNARGRALLHFNMGVQSGNSSFVLGFHRAG